MENGTLIETTCHVRGEGRFFIPPGTKGKILFAVGENAYRCEFGNVMVPTQVEPATVTATVLANTIYEILTHA